MVTVSTFRLRRFKEVRRRQSRTRIHASVAQLAEQRSPKPQVVGSSPTWRATCGSYAKRGSPRTNPPTWQSGNFVNSRLEQPKTASPADEIGRGSCRERVCPKV